MLAGELNRCICQAGAGIGGDRDDRERDRQRWGDDLRRHAFNGIEGGPQRLVTSHDLVEGTFERGDVQRSSEPKRARHVVRRVVRGQLVDEPHLLLCGRQGHRVVCLPPWDPSGRGLIASAASERFCERGDCRRFEECGQAQILSEYIAQPRNDLSRRERVAAKVEEVVVDADGIHTQDVAPHVHDLPLDLVRRGSKRRLEVRTRRLRVGQRAAIHFAVRRRRERVEHDERRRHHVCGQACGERTPQRNRIRFRPSRDQEIGHEPRLSARVVARHDDRFTRLRQAEEGRFDLSRFDSMAANLYLEILAAHVNETVIGQQPAQVAGEIDALAALCAAVDEGLARLLGLAPVPRREVAALHRNFADLAVSDRLPAVVEKRDFVVGDRVADGHRTAVDARVLVDEVPANRARLRAAQPIDQPAGRGKELLIELYFALRDRLANELDESQVAEVFAAGQSVTKVAEDSGDGCVGRHAFAKQPVGEAVEPLRLHIERVHRRPFSSPQNISCAAPLTAKEKSSDRRSDAASDSPFV